MCARKEREREREKEREREREVEKRNSYLKKFESSFATWTCKRYRANFLRLLMPTVVV